jgi:hypothetical protein
VGDENHRVGGIQADADDIEGGHHDGASAAFDHRRHGEANHADRAHEQQVEGFLPGRVVLRHRDTSGRSAGVGEQEIDAAERKEGRFVPSGECVDGGDVGGGGEHVGSGFGADLFGRGLNRRVVARGDGDFGAFFGKCSGDGEAEASAGAGDHGDFVGESGVHGGSLILQWKPSTNGFEKNCRATRKVRARCSKTGSVLLVTI